MLRTAVIVVAALVALTGIVLIFFAGPLWPIGVQLTCVGLLFLFGALFERWRYVKNVSRASAGWQPTGERFTDPTTGVLTEVFYNAQTGQRDYRETKD